MMNHMINGISFLKIVKWGKAMAGYFILKVVDFLTTNKSKQGQFGAVDMLCNLEESMDFFLRF